MAMSMKVMSQLTDHCDRIKGVLVLFQAMSKDTVKNLKLFELTIDDRILLGTGFVTRT